MHKRAKISKKMQNLSKMCIILLKCSKTQQNCAKRGKIVQFFCVKIQQKIHAFPASPAFSISVSLSIDCNVDIHMLHFFSKTDSQV